MAWWVKMDAHLDNNPKAIEAGYVGVAVFCAVLRVNGCGKFDGLIPPAHASAAYIARCTGAPIKWVAEGLAACERIPEGEDTGLLQREPDGSLRICGWDNDWRPPASSAERMQALRERRKQAVTESDARVTESDGALRDVTDVTQLDLEEKRSDLDQEESRSRQEELLVPPSGTEVVSKKKGKKDKPPLPFTVERLLDVLNTASAGRVAIAPFDRRLAPPLTAVIRDLDAQSVTIEDVRLAGEWVRAGGIDCQLAVNWVATTGKLADAIAKARAWDAAGRPSVRPVRGKGGMSVDEILDFAKELKDEQAD